MNADATYDSTLPRTIASLIHKHGLRTVLRELAAYCKVEWIQAKMRSEAAEQWRETSEALIKVAEDFASKGS